MIRSFTKDDIESIYTLGDCITTNFSKTNDLLQILQDRYTKILVYVEENKVIGFLMYTELEETADILNIVVQKEFRERKIASCLMDYMISDLKTSVKLVTLEVRKSNIPAIKLYEKFGFEIVNIRKKYYEEEDAYLMGRRIER